jgi:hypothetical protein
MPADFLPRREALLRDWSRNFRDRIATAPESFALTPEQAAHYAALHDAFAALYAAAHDNGARTPSVIVAKSVSKSRLLDEARNLARIVRAAPDVSDAQRCNLGLSARREGRPRGTIGVPDGPPSLFVEQVVGRTVHLRLRDPAHPTRSGRPLGLAGASVFRFVAAGAGDPPPALADWTFVGSATRNRFAVECPAALPPGTLVWFAAYWFNPRQVAGPVSAPTYAYLQGGVASARAA